MHEEMALLKALADENRVRLLMALRQGELCVCQLIALLDLAPSTVSKHLSQLKQARLVTTRKAGRWIYYSLPGKQASAGVRRTLNWLERLLGDHRQLAADQERLQTILSRDPEELCRLVTAR
jgi:DNA-binding transcriptional ArsR family regulator